LNCFSASHKRQEWDAAAGDHVLSSSTDQQASFEISIDSDCDETMNVFLVRTVRTQHAAMKAKSANGPKHISAEARSGELRFRAPLLPSVLFITLRAMALVRSPVQLIKNAFLGDASSLLPSRNGASRSSANHILPFSNVLPKQRR